MAFMRDKRDDTKEQQDKQRAKLQAKVRTSW